jgi:C_GCAxxG_C_C family probable redox protein
MTPKQQKAHDYFYSGYNCAQSVFAAFHEEMGLSEDTALKLMVSMGGGVGGLREICGAFTGAAMALNMIQNDIKTTDPDYKKRIYALVQEKAEAFKAQYGTLICRELLELNDITPSPAPAVRDAKYYEVRPCGKYVEYAAGLVEEELLKR